METKVLETFREIWERRLQEYPDPLTLDDLVKLRLYRNTEQSHRLRKTNKEKVPIHFANSKNNWMFEKNFLLEYLERTFSKTNF